MSERTNSVEVGGELVMPFYVLCDVSWSMCNDIDKLNEGLQELVRAIRAEPIVDDVVRIAVMSFSDTARVVLPLGQASEGTFLQDLTPEGGTNYSAAFRALKSTIDEDIADLKKRGLKMFRPCVFFLTDGEPYDTDWKTMFSSILTYDKEHDTGNKKHPIFVPFGFRDAAEADMKFLAYPPGKSKWFFARTNQIQDALEEFFLATLFVMCEATRIGVDSALSSASELPLQAWICSGVQSVE